MNKWKNDKTNSKIRQTNNNSGLEIFFVASFCHRFTYFGPNLSQVCDFHSLDSFFKKRQQEKQLKRPRPDGDNESVEDVDDDEFEKLLGELRHSVQSEQVHVKACRGRQQCASCQLVLVDAVRFASSVSISQSVSIMLVMEF